MTGLARAGLTSDPCHGMRRGRHGDFEALLSTVQARSPKVAPTMNCQREVTGPTHEAAPRAVHGASDDGRRGDRGRPLRCQRGARSATEAAPGHLETP